MPSNTAVRRTGTETLTIRTLYILSSAATEKERIAFVKQHLRAIEMCGSGQSSMLGWLAVNLRTSKSSEPTYAAGRGSRSRRSTSTLGRLNPSI